MQTIAAFETTWAYESASTIKLLEMLTDASLAQPVVPGGRTLGFLAWHLVVTIPEMFGHAKIAVEGGPGEHDPVPATAAEIVEGYRAAAAQVVPAVKAAWTDAELNDLIPMYGEQWPKSGVLYGLVAHQAHHRGQMTVLMRQAGLLVPGIYGPAKEEWAQMGMPTLP
jgi:uncharacterized damage-inducible protein DinB